jgi:hypothetical protein
LETKGDEYTTKILVGIGLILLALSIIGMANSVLQVNDESTTGSIDDQDDSLISGIDKEKPISQTPTVMLGKKPCHGVDC